MNTNQVEILKLGSIMTTKQANNLRRLNIVCDGGPIFDYYRKIIVETTSQLFEFYDTQKIFVGGPFPFNDTSRLIGTIEHPPIPGQDLVLKNQRWYSSRITLIIENCIVVTKNSVYAIHDLSQIRNQKISELGI